MWLCSPLYLLLLPRYVINQQILTEVIGTGIERPATVELRHLIDKCAQTRTVVEHESIDGNLALGRALDFSQRLLRRAHTDAAERQRPLAVQATARKIGGGLTVSDDDDVLIMTGVTVQQVAGQAYAVLQVGKRVAHVPARLGQIFNLEFHRTRKKSDDREIIARVARMNQALQRQRHFLSRGETSLPAH